MRVSVWYGNAHPVHRPRTKRKMTAHISVGATEKWACALENLEV